MTAEPAAARLPSAYPTHLRALKNFDKLPKSLAPQRG